MTCRIARVHFLQQQKIQRMFYMENLENLENKIYEKLLEKMDISESDIEGFTFDSPIFTFDHTTEGVCMGLDSLDTLELIVTIYETWGIDIPPEEAKNLLTVNMIADYIRKHIG